MKKITIFIMLAALLFIGCTGSGNNGTAEPDIGTRSNPAGIGDMIRLEYQHFTRGHIEIDIALIEVIRGEEANDIVADANPYNREPEEGEEYLLAMFYVKAVDIEQEPFSINHAQFDAVSAGGVVYDEFLSISGLDPNLRNDLYENAEHEGLTYFLIEAEDSPLIAYHRTRNYNLWFDPNPEENEE